MKHSTLHSAVVISLSLVVAACSPAYLETAFSEAAAEYTDHFADNGLGNAVAVVQHPAGEHHDGITYVSYQGPLEDPYVATYNHDTGEWFGPFKAGTSAMGKDPSRKIDNHGKPTLIIDDAGYIHIFFGGHGGLREVHGENPLGNHHYGENKHVVSKRPYDITEWEELDTIPPFGTYNQVVKMDNGDIYLFYRHGAHRSDWVYHRSTDNGRTFGEPVSFLKHKRRDDLPAVDSWYPYVTKGVGDEIIVNFDYHLCWDNDGAPDERGHTANRQDIYYMVFDTGDNEWRNIHGQTLPMPLTREVAEERALVARSGELWSFNGPVTLDNKGFPHIGITMGEDLGVSKTGGPKEMRHYRWTGSEWVGGKPGVLPISNGAIAAEEPEHVRFVLASQNQTGEGNVSWWESKDGGESFVKTRELLRRPNANFAISSFIRNAHPDAKLIVAERLRGTDRRNMYLLGENGPVVRATSSR
uniref:BNR-4 repeat-containing protein n=1 Tax=uncultured Altererythrobacter sp. TaxID=500840 RepID=UPI0026316FE7|nr:BNR-4 repeat-containing protein [uncultured Altererythrobacter sp.]